MLGTTWEITLAEKYLRLPEGGVRSGGFKSFKSFVNHSRP